MDAVLDAALSSAILKCTQTMERGVGTETHHPFQIFTHMDSDRKKNWWDYTFEVCLIIGMAVAIYLGFQFLNEISMYN